jgi:hypothetical protein
MAEIGDYVPLIAKLLAKTKESRIEWKATVDQQTFLCVLDGRYSFEIQKTRSASGTPIRRLAMKDSEAEDVFHKTAYTPANTTSDENDALFELLDELYERARMTALKIDAKLRDANSILDRI